MKTNLNNCIFIVDDDPFWTSILTELLREIGYTNIFTFEYGLDCIENLGLYPDTVFLDFKMSDINGLEVLRQIKDFSEDIDVIFCTAYEDLRVALNAIQHGSFEYLLKLNTNREELKSILSRLSEHQLLEGKTDLI